MIWMWFGPLQTHMLNIWLPATSVILNGSRNLGGGNCNTYWKIVTCVYMEVQKRLHRWMVKGEVLVVNKKEKMSRGIYKSPEQSKGEADWTWPRLSVRDGRTAGENRGGNEIAREQEDSKTENKTVDGLQGGWEAVAGRLEGKAQETTMVFKFCNK